MKAKKILLIFFLVLIFLAVFIFVTVYLNEREEDLISEKVLNNIQKYKPIISDEKTINDNWYFNLNKLDKNDSCVNGILKQIDYLKKEKLSKLITFDKYLTTVFNRKLKDLDVSSSDSAKMFRTVIRYDLKNKGVNFAGHYTITSVGMTGWGENYWIVDRENGKAFEFPFHADFIDFRKDSSLIIIDPKYMIIDYMKNSENYYDFCMEEIWLPKYFEIKPSYVFWDDNDKKVKIVDSPKNPKPMVSPFWGIE